MKKFRDACIIHLFSTDFDDIRYISFFLPNKNEEKILADSSKDELEKLIKIRAEFESKLAAKWKYRTPLELEAEILRKKVAIQKLKEELGRVDDRAAKIDLERRELEDKLESTKEVATSETIQKTKAEVEDKKEKPETDEQTRVIWKKEDPTPISWKKDEQTPESDKTAQSKKSKKKRKFF